MKIAIIGADMAFCTALASVLDNFEGRGIVIVNVDEETKFDNLEKLKNNMNTHYLSRYLFEALMYYEPIILNSNKGDKEQFKNQLKHKTTFNHQPRIKNSFVQRRHVPTNRGK